MRNNPERKCKACEIEVEDVNYIFCSIECQTVWIWLKEKHMGKYDIDKDLYTEWFKDKTESVEKMTKEDIEARIGEIINIKFYANREWSMLHDKWDKLVGRKGIAPWLKEERDKLITEPNIKVNWDGDPRKKEKKPKENLLKNLLDIDLSDITREMKLQGKHPKGSNGNTEKKVEEKKEKPSDMSILLRPAAPKVEKSTVSEDEIQKQADALKEKMRLIREGNK